MPKSHEYTFAATILKTVTVEAPTTGEARQKARAWVEARLGGGEVEHLDLDSIDGECV